MTERSDRADQRDDAANQRDDRANTRDSNADSRETVTDGVVRRSYALTKILVLMVVFLFGITIALEVQVQQRNRNIDRVEKVVGDAKQASIDSKQAVDNAISASQNQSVPSAQQISAAIVSIQRIEDQLCGGPCPEK